MLTCLIGGVTVLAQGPRFSSRVDIVSLVVSVTDESGQHVSGLDASSFSVTEDGKVRPVASVVAERVPVSVAIALDLSKSMLGDRLKFASQAVRMFAGQLNADDQLGLIGFNDKPFLMSPLTSVATAVLAPLASAKPNGQTALYEAIELALDVVKAAVNRKTAIIVISDGNDAPRGMMTMPSSSGQQASGVTSADLRAMRERSALERIRRSAALVYAVGVNAPAFSSEDPAAVFDAPALMRLTDSSGGFAQIVTAADAIPAATRAIIAELNQQYLVGFVPEHVADTKFHRIEVGVRGCRCRVRARSGFVASK